MEYRFRKNSHRIIKLFGVLIALATVFFVSAYFINNSGVLTKESDSDSDFSGDTRDFHEISSRTVSFGSASWAGLSSEQETALFSQVSSIGRSNYDEWIVSLDCGLDNIDAKDVCDADLAGQFSELFGVANITDAGASLVSRDTTTSYLSKSGVQFFGGSGELFAENMCEVVSLNARLESKDRAYQSASLPIVLCGVDISDAVKPAAISEVQKYSMDLPVWVYIYNKTDATDTLGSSSRSLYQSYVDAGADLVLGVGDASLEPVEKYGNGLIIYSLGRFIGMPLTSKAQVSAIGLGVEIRHSMDPNVQEWAEIAKTCSGFNDLCIEAAKSKQLNKLKYDYKYTIIPVDVSNPYIPKAGDDTLEADTIEKLNWIPLQ